MYQENFNKMKKESPHLALYELGEILMGFNKKKILNKRIKIH